MLNFMLALFDQCLLPNIAFDLFPILLFSVFSTPIFTARND